MDKICFVLWAFVLISRLDFVISKLLFYNYEKTDCIHVNCTPLTQTSTPSMADCVGKCGENSACFGVRFAANDKLCHFLPHSCFHPPVCSNKCANASCYEKSFCDRGYWSSESKKCVCNETGGYVGVHCERLPHNCTDLFNHGYRPVLEYWYLIDVYKNGSKNISLLCGFTFNTVFTYIAKSTGRHLDKNRKLSEYVSGYNVSNSDFFIGLQNMFALNQQGFTDVRVDIFLYNSSQYSGWYNIYNGLKVSDESSGYQLYVGTYKSFFIGDSAKQFPGMTMGDVLGRSAQVPFSAYDSDKDLDIYLNCASQQGVGWWYKNCTDVNLFGTLVNATLRVPGLNMSDPRIIALYSGMNFCFHLKI